MLFDQYQRYKNAEIVINSIREKEERLNILEVGANEHKNLEEFLPNDKVTYLDIVLSEERKNDPAYILGDATRMDIESDSYDIVVALDVYEHVLPERRKAFLSEINRVASRLFIIGAPFDTLGVSESENRVNSVYRCLYGTNHPWLIEHIENGLPQLEQTIKCLNALGCEVDVFSHGSLRLWERLTNIELASVTDVELANYAEKIFDIYNKYAFEADYGDDSYRHFVVGTKNGNRIQINIKENDTKSLELLDELEKQFWILHDTAKQTPASTKYQLVCYYKTEDVTEFSEECCKKKNFKPGSNRFVVDFSDCKKITELRIDPLNCNCIIQNFCVRESGNARRLEVLSSNGLYDENKYIFNTTDPMFFVEVPEAGIEKIEVSFDVVEYENNIIEQLYQGGEKRKVLIKEKDELIAQKEKLAIEKEELATEKEELEKHLYNIESELAHYKTHYFAAINQREDLKVQLSEMNQKYDAVINSSCWRITRPLRFVFERIKKICHSNRFLYLFAKGIKSLLTEGFRATWNKVRFTIVRVKDNRKYYRQMVLSKKEQEFQKNKKFERDIVFSIIVPLYNTPKNFLKEMIESVQDQTYAKWELCLADGSDDKYSYVEKICRQYIRKDKRIKYKKLDNNLGISENTNAAIEMATGDYIGLFDHDDLLHPSVLYEYMNVICEKNADFIYCDELTFEGTLEKIITMHFKPDFAIDNLRANNYICHFSVFDKKLLNAVGGFRKEFDGSQDHDMIFRLTEKANKIIHIPKILYFWRSHPNSVAADINSKSYAIEAGKKAVREHLERCGECGIVESTKAFPTIYRIKYDILHADKVSIIIPNCNHVEDLRKCVYSIQKLTTYTNYEILIVENNSSEESIFEYYKKVENNQIKIINWDKPFNYSAINNYAASLADGKYLLFLNNDTEVIEATWIEELIMYAQRNSVGAVGAKLYYPDDTIQHAGIILGMGADGVAGHGHYRVHRTNLGYMGRLYYAQNVSAVTAACMMIRKEVFVEVNGFDEEFTVAYNDVDLCMKVLKAGYLNVFNPYAELYHYESISRGAEDTLEKRVRFEKEVMRFKEKWEKELEIGDHYYNPNLTLAKADFSIK